MMTQKGDPSDQTVALRDDKTVTKQKTTTLFFFYQNYSTNTRSCTQ